MRIKVQKWVVAFFCLVMTLVSSPLLAQQTGKSIVRLVYSPVRQGGGDVLAISWRTDFKASLASAVLTADSGQFQHLQLKHENLRPVAQLSSGPLHAPATQHETDFYDEFTYGPGKNIFSQMGPVQVEIIVWESANPPVEAARRRLDIDLEPIDDYFGTLNQLAELRVQVASLRTELGRAPLKATIKPEQVHTLDRSIILLATSDQPVRLHAAAYLGSEENAVNGRPIAKSERQNVTQGDPKTLVIRGLTENESYVVQILDDKENVLFGPITRDQTGRPLKTLAKINQPHLEIGGKIIKPKAVVLNLTIRDTAKLRAQIQQANSRGEFSDIPGAQSEHVVEAEYRKPGTDFPYSLTVDVPLDPEPIYRAVVDAVTAYDEAEQDAHATSETFHGVKSELFKTVTMTVTQKGLRFTTDGTEELKMSCTAKLPNVSLTIPPDIEKATPTKTPSCSFDNSDLFPKPKSKPQSASKDASAPSSPTTDTQPSIIQFSFEVEPNDKSARKQTQTLAFSAISSDINSKKLSEIAQAVNPDTNGGGGLKVKALSTGTFGTILRLFVTAAAALAK